MDSLHEVSSTHKGLTDKTYILSYTMWILCGISIIFYFLILIYSILKRVEYKSVLIKVNHHTITKRWQKGVYCKKCLVWKHCLSLSLSLWIVTQALKFPCILKIAISGYEQAGTNRGTHTKTPACEELRKQRSFWQNCSTIPPAVAGGSFPHPALTFPTCKARYATALPAYLLPNTSRLLIPPRLSTPPLSSSSTLCQRSTWGACTPRQVFLLKAIINHLPFVSRPSALRS